MLHFTRYNPTRRNSDREGERHSSLAEQAESALLWERIRNAKSQKEALAHYRAALAAAEGEQRVSRDRKKGTKARKPKPVYTKEYLAAKGMPRRNPLPMESDPFHPSKWRGNSTKGAFLKVFPKGSRNTPSSRGWADIEPVVSLESGFPLVRLEARYETYVPEHWASERVLVDDSPGHLLVLDYTFMTPEGQATWRVRFGPHIHTKRPMEQHLEAPTSLVEAARVTKRHFESLFGQARLNPARRNPLEMYRRPDDLFSVSIPFTSSTPLSVEFSKIEPGEQRRFRLLPNSQKEAGWLKPILGNWLSADDALNLAVEAEGLSKNMYSSYPRHEYRDAARFYEGMSVVFFGLAEAVQTPWGR